MTKTNDEALQVTGLLLKNGMKAKLIQSNDGFNLYSLLEIRFFLSKLFLDEGIYTISDDVWEAERYFKERNIKVQSIDLKQKSLSKGEFESVKKAVGLDALINRNAKEYKQLKPSLNKV